MYGELGSIGTKGRGEGRLWIDFAARSVGLVVIVVERRSEPLVGPGLVIGTIPVSGMSPASLRERRGGTADGVEGLTACFFDDRLRGGRGVDDWGLSSRGRLGELTDWGGYGTSGIERGEFGGVEEKETSERGDGEVGVAGEFQTLFGVSGLNQERRGALIGGQVETEEVESTRIESEGTKGSEEGSGPSSASTFRLWW
jgi:hypothetical protein